MSTTLIRYPGVVLVQPASLTTALSPALVANVSAPSATRIALCRCRVPFRCHALLGTGVLQRRAPALPGFFLQKPLLLGERLPRHQRGPCRWN
jgi:hypothetical protein